MDPETERHVSRGLAIDVQLRWTREPGRVTVCRRQRHRDAVPLVDHLTVQLDVFGGGAVRVVLVDGEIAQEFLDRGVDLRRIRAEPRQLVFVVQQGEHADGQRALRGFVAREQQQCDDVAQLLPGQLAVADQGADEIVLGLPTTPLDDLVEVCPCLLVGGGGFRRVRLRVV